MQFKIFKKENLIQGISEVSFGSMKNIKKRKWNFSQAVKFLKFLGYQDVSSKKLIWMEQVFNSKVHICQKKDSGRVIENVDGLITNIPEQILVSTSADCLPILLYDSKKKIIANLHGGRECLVKGIIKKAIEKMKVYFGAQPKEILVALGPHVRKCHYWLKEKTYQKLKNTKFKKYLLKKKGKIHMDLTKLAIDQLLELGIQKKNIEDSKICTFCSYKKYFSARKEEENPKIYSQKNPRFANFLGIQKL
jgi:hypothetical protein